MHDIWFYSLASVFIISLASFAGIFTLLIREDLLKKILLFLVSFSAGALIGDSFIHLLPEAIGTGGFTLDIAFSLMAGILLFFVLEKFVHWRHCHIPTSKNHPHPLAMMNLIGDGFHNFIDGMIIAGSYMVDFKIGIATTIAVILHEIPQEISDIGVLLHAGLSKNKALFYNFVSALASCLGAVSALLIGGSSGYFLSLLVPFTIGGFIYIASADLIPELHKETDPKKSVMQLFGIVSGIGVMLLLLIVR
jgi:zinc and cadmium transporter